MFPMSLECGKSNVYRAITGAFKTDYKSSKCKIVVSVGTDYFMIKYVSVKNN